MRTHDPDRDATAMNEVRRIASLESRGAWEQALDAWHGLIARTPDFMPARLGRAQAYLRSGRAAEAVADLDDLTARFPAAPGPWLALAVARSALGRHDDAIAAAENAVAAAPDHAVALLGLGDVLRQARRVEQASEAYSRAVALAPENVDALNKLATMRRMLGDTMGATTLLARALELAPTHPYVRVNAGTLALALHHWDEGRDRLLDALDDPALPADARKEAQDVLAMFEEGEALTPAVELAAETDDPTPIATALSGRKRLAAADPALVDLFGAMVDGLAGRSDLANRYARGRPRSSAWPAIEAHHHFLETRTREAIADSVNAVEQGVHASSDVGRDIEHYAGLVATCAAVIERMPRHPLDDDPIVFEALLRWVHARLVRHRRDRRPGCFKVGAFPRLALRGHSPRHPVHTQPTLGIVLRDLMPRLPDGPLRYAFLHVALVTLQPFADCNTRVASFLQNRLLAQGGWFPSLRPPRDDRGILNRTLADADLEPMIVALAAGSHEAEERDREWAAHGAA